MAGDERVVDDGHAGHPAHAIAWPAVEAARRNVELKARRPATRRPRSPARSPPARRTGASLAPARHLLRRRRAGRLKLREEEPGGATLIAYERPDAGAARACPRYRLVAVPDPAALRAALAGDLRRPRRGREAAPAAAVGERPHPPRRGRRASAASSSSRRSRTPGSDLARERAQVDAPARARWRSRDAALTDGLLRRRAGGRQARPRAPARSPARRRRNAYAPYSHFPVGAAVRTDGRPPLRRRQRRERRLPAGPVRGGVRDRGDGGRRRRPVAEVVVAAPSRELCTPCGGCRQRLREFAPPDAPSTSPTRERVGARRRSASCCRCPSAPEHLAAMTRRRRSRRRRRASARRASRRASGSCSAPGLGARRRRARPTASRSPTATCPASAPAGRRPRRHARARPPRRRAASPIFSGRAHLYEGSTASAIATPVRTLQRARRRARSLLTNAAGSLRARGRPGQPRRHHRPHQPAGLQPAHRPERRRDRPALPEPARRLRPGAARAPARGGGRSARRCTRASTSPSPGPSFETPAEIRAFRTLGADLVGMSHRARGDRRAPRRPARRRRLRRHQPGRGHGRRGALATSRRCAEAARGAERLARSSTASWRTCHDRPAVLARRVCR